MAYHYPQQPGQQPAPGNPRQGLSSLEPVSQAPSDYGAYPPAQPAGYGHAPPAHAQQRGFNPNGAPDYRQWSQPAPMPDQHAYPPQQDPLQAQADWAQHSAHFGYGETAPEENYQGGQPAYQQPQQHQNTLEQGYAPDEAPDYEVEEGRRGSWTLRIAGAIVVAIGLGYGLAQGYKLIAGAEPDGATPVVRSDTEPARTAPTDPGGKQFAHTDSKVMGRLGEAGPSAGEAGTVSASSDTASSGTAELSESDTDASGARKVTTLVVGRDGSITPPAAPAGAESSEAVPGLTVVDGFGGRYPGAESAPAPQTQETASAPAAEVQPAVAKPSTPDKPEMIAAVKTPPQKPAPVEPVVLTTTSEPSPAAEQMTAALAPPKETAAIPSKPPAAAPEASSGSNGYVVVLASVPVSGQSRLSALKKFADMQEKYGTVLQNKTPDVQEANLGEKGSYHRLLVGPPGSRAQASSLCADLKTAGYKDCWVTAY